MRTSPGRTRHPPRLFGHFRVSKERIEDYLRALGLPLNVVRPVFFMDNLIQLHMIGRNSGVPHF